MWKIEYMQPELEKPSPVIRPDPHSSPIQRCFINPHKKNKNFWLQRYACHQDQKRHVHTVRSQLEEPASPMIRSDRHSNRYPTARSNSAMLHQPSREKHTNRKSHPNSKECHPHTNIQLNKRSTAITDCLEFQLSTILASWLPNDGNP